MFADTLLALERAHLLRVALWGGASLLVGSVLLALLALRRARTAVEAPLPWHFAIQTAAWGAVDLVIVLLGARGLALRDHAAATRLDRILWLNLGLDAGYVGVGVTLALTGWLLARRLGLVGAGLGVAVQGTALFVLDLIVVRQLAGTL
jgi:hypothetical protein